jgi:hypothetical protein
MGVESAAILTRWLIEPESRDFPLEDLIVLTAQTGDEFSSTARQVEKHLLPLMVLRGVRWIQVARAEASTKSLAVISDSRAETSCHIEGVYKLSTEMLTSGTIPTRGGIRKCSMKSKGSVLDSTLAQIIGEREFTHAIGFNADEGRRSTKDCSYGGPRFDGRRAPSYPLQDWGWSRQMCLDYLMKVFGVVWLKSACAFCPFSNGKAELRGRWMEEPDKAALSARMEFNSLGLNPRIGLFASGSVLSHLQATDNTKAIALYEEALERDAWAVYRVQRLPGASLRKVSILFTGSRDEAQAEVSRLAAEAGLPLEQNCGYDRFWVTERSDAQATPREELVVAIPADAKAKHRVSSSGKDVFASSWEKVLAAEAQPELAIA